MVYDMLLGGLCTLPSSGVLGRSSPFRRFGTKWRGQPFAREEGSNLLHNYILHKIFLKEDV